jgi:integrase/recombinase XerC
VDQLLGKWSTWMRAAGKPDTTIELRLYQVRRVLAGIDSPPHEVIVDQLVDWLGGQAWAPSTRRSYRAALRGFFQWVQAIGLRPDNPALLIPVVHVPRSIPRPTPEAVYRQALLESDDRTRLMVQLAAKCGLRRGEISRVRREHVLEDLVGWSLRVEGKGGHQRVVPLPTDLSVELRAMPPGWVFPSDRRPGPLTPAHVGVLVSRALPPGWTCHTLRHRCATVAYAVERDLRAVQELLGHAKPETTALYTQVPQDAVRRAVAAAAA